MTTYRYDAVGNLTNVVYPVSSNIVLNYDALNRLTNMVDGVGTTRYSYDAVGQLLSEDGPWTNDTVTYIYTNRFRNSLSLLQPGASPWAQAYAYDATQRLTNITTSVGAFGYQYAANASPLVHNLTLPNRANIANGHDAVGRLTGTYLESGSMFLDGYTYYYDQAGERTNITRNVGIAVSTCR